MELRYNLRNPLFRQFRKIEIDKRARTWYDLISEEIRIVESKFEHTRNRTQ